MLAAVFAMVAVRMGSNKESMAKVYEQTVPRDNEYRSTIASSDVENSKNTNSNALQRMKTLLGHAAVEAKKNELIDLGDGDFARREDHEFDKLANARGKYMSEGFDKLDSMLEGKKDAVAEKRVYEELKRMVSEDKTSNISLGEVACVEQFCRLHLTGETLDSTVTFLDKLKMNDNLTIASSEFSPNINLNEEPENPDDASNIATTTDVYFSLDSGVLPVNPTDFSSIDSQV